MSVARIGGELALVKDQAPLLLLSKTKSGQLAEGPVVAATSVAPGSLQTTKDIAEVSCLRVLGEQLLCTAGQRVRTTIQELLTKLNKSDNAFFSQFLEDTKRVTDEIADRLAKSEAQVFVESLG